MYNITIGICSGGTIHVETVTNLIAAMNLCKEKGLSVALTIQIGGYTAHNRNKIVEVARANGSSHLMFIDADQTFPASGIVRLYDHDKDIVGGLYNTRGSYNDQGQLISTLKLADKDGNLINGSEVPNQLFTCAALGTGFMLIKMSVFDKLEKPYFVAWESPEGEHCTEDVQFCKNAHEVGFEIWCSPTINVGHIGQKIY